MIRTAACLGGVFALLAVIHLSAGSLAWTGDEIGYAYEGLGLYENNAYYPSGEQWNSFLASSGRTLPFAYHGALRKPYNSLAPAAAYGGLLARFGLEPARWLSYVLGCLGLIALYKTLALLRSGRSERANQIAPLLTTALVALALPLIAYMQLLYPEALLFLCVSAILYAVSRRMTVAVLVLGALLPWIHIRALPMMLVLFALLALEVFPRFNVRQRVGVLCACTAAIGAFAVFQIHVFGSMTGGAFSTRVPSWNIVPERLGMQLFDVRHGLIAYSPVFLLGFAGLAAGCIRRNRMAVQSSALLLSYIATFIWSNAGESWTGRFWVAGVPSFAVGLYSWLQAIPSARWAVAILPPALITYFNTYIFATKPGWFLSSARLSIPYTWLNSWAHVHFGLYLPLDADPGTLESFSRTIPALLVYTFLTIVALTLVTVGSRLMQKTAWIAAGVLLVLPYAACAVSELPASQYRTMLSAKAASVTATFQKPSNALALQLTDTININWYAPNVPRNFEIECRSVTGVIFAKRVPSRPLLLLDGCNDATAITVRQIGTSSGEFYDRLKSVDVLVPVL